MAQGFTSERLSLHLGAELKGIDLAAALDADDVRALREQLLEHHVLFFRDQQVDAEALKTLARHFGSIDVHPFGRHIEGDPEVGLLDQTNPEQDGANNWHTDSTFMPQPPFGSVLASVKLPDIGGDTSWASNIAAYDRLSPQIQKMLGKLSATHDVSGPLLRAIAGGHSIGSIDDVRAKWPPVSHPVICRHPETGRRMLFVNSNFTTQINELPEAESAALLKFLFEHIRTPELQIRFRWQEGSVVLWDNRCTQHYASADYQQRRVMHRVAITGTWSPS